MLELPVFVEAVPVVVGAAVAAFPSADTAVTVHTLPAADQLNIEPLTGAVASPGVLDRVFVPTAGKFPGPYNLPEAGAPY